MRPYFDLAGIGQKRTIHWVACIALVFALGLFGPVLAQELSAEQQQKLNAVTSGLNRVKTNLQLAMGSAGPGTAVPQGSKAKLSKMRLDSAAVDMPQLKQWLSELPADAPEVQTVAAEYAGVEEGITALSDRLAGKNVVPPAAPTATPATAPVAATAAAPVAPAAPPAAPAATPPAAPAPAAVPTTVRLGYPLDGVLKDARFNLREVQGNAVALTKMVAELQPQEDQLAINFRTVNKGMTTLENGRRKAGFTQDALNQLPANGQGVSETVEELAAANSQMDAAEAYLAPLNQKLTNLINPANYPDLQADLKRLAELSSMYRAPQILQTDRPRAAAVLTEATAAKTEAIRISQAYLPLMVQETDEGKRVEGSGNNFLGNQAAFLAAAEAEKQALPQQIRSDLAEASKIADEAVAKQKPLFFTGGVPQIMDYAEDKLALYTVLNPANAATLEREVQQMQASLNQREASLGELIIQQNTLPPDRYIGQDRDKIVAVAIDAWTYQQKNFDVLTSRIPSENWNRETLWQYSNGTWYYVDRSKLQVQLIVADKDDDKLAIIRPVNIWMDHQKGDSMIGTPFYSGDDDLQPSAYMLRDKVN